MFVQSVLEVIVAAFLILGILNEEKVAAFERKIFRAVKAKINRALDVSSNKRCKSQASIISISGNKF